MPRTSWSLNRERVALQAEQVHLAQAQVTGIVRSVRCMTTTASLGLHRYMFINKRTHLVCVALATDGIPTGQCPRLPQSRGSVNVVAIAASDESFVDSMVIRFGEVSLRRRVTSVAEVGLCFCQQVLRIFRAVRGVTIQAAD